MHAYAFIGDIETVSKKADEFIREHQAKRMDYEVQKIDQVRQVGKFVSLGVTEPTVLVLSGLGEASEAAQNALLKTLEEPQENLFFVLLAGSSEGFLPTITSRVEVVEMGGLKQNGVKSVKGVNDFLKAETGGRLAITSMINKRDEAVEFVEGVMREARGNLGKQGKAGADLIEKAGECLLALKQNGNVQLQLTSFVSQI